MGDLSITAAVKSVMLVVQHNSFFNIMDHLAPLIGKNFQPVVLVEVSFVVKTDAINNCIRDHFFDELKEKMAHSPFSIILDGSNDTGLGKMYPVTVHIFDVDFNRIMKSSLT